MLILKMQEKKAALAGEILSGDSISFTREELGKYWLIEHKKGR